MFVPLNSPHHHCSYGIGANDKPNPFMNADIDDLEKMLPELLKKTKWGLWLPWSPSDSQRVFLGAFLAVSPYPRKETKRKKEGGREMAGRKEKKWRENKTKTV